MKLARKLVGPQLVLLALLTVLAATQLWVTRREQRDLETSTSRLQQEGLRIQRLGQLFSDTERDLLSVFVSRDETLVRRILSSNRELEQLLSQLEQGDWTPRGSSLVEDLRRMRPALTGAQDELLAAGRSLSPDERKAAFVRWWFLDQRANALLADLSAYNLKRVDRVLAEVREGRRRFDVFLVFLAVACGLTVAGLTFYVLRGVVAPLVELTAASQQVGAGGTVPRFTGRGDELETLSGALAETTERMVGTNARLGEALAARDQFISVAAHELRTPLTSLGLQLSLLKRGVQLGAERETLARTVAATERQILRMTQLINDLLDVTRIQAGRLELHREPVRLEALVREVCARCAPLLEAGQNALDLDLDPSVVSDVDSSRLDQVLVNLLANAARHAPGAAIRVSLVAGADDAVLSVRDGGPGIPEPVRSRIFERFVRMPGSPTGLGLGLFICRQIVDAHGGTIEVQSEPGHGTAFVVRLPRLAPVAPGEAATAGAQKDDGPAEMLPAGPLEVNAGTAQ
jgi:signal transduction histidine kinase